MPYPAIISTREQIRELQLKIPDKPFMRPDLRDYILGNALVLAAYTELIITNARASHIGELLEIKDRDAFATRDGDIVNTHLGLANGFCKGLANQFTDMQRDPRGSEPWYDTSFVLFVRMMEDWTGVGLSDIQTKLSESEPANIAAPLQ
jgi:hypothetical protein